MANETPIHDDELEKLLKELSLSEGNDAAEEQAAFVFAQDYDAEPDAEKAQQMLDKLHKNTTRPRGRGKYIFLLCVVLVGTVGLVWFLSGSRSAEQKTSAPALHPSSPGASGSIAESPSLEASASTAQLQTPPDTFGRVHSIRVRSMADTTPQAKTEIPVSTVHPNEQQVPYLADADKLRYWRVKEMMLKALIMFDKKLYTHVEPGKLDYKGKSTVVEPFYMRNMGITNLEYKTFLADLLAQNRKDDYLQASVHMENWEATNGHQLAQLYFADETYNDFPVVNITTTGATLFCTWLEQEITLYIQQHHLKADAVQVRLPYDDEWLYAAREGFAKIAYEPGYNTLFDLSEGLADQHFVNRVELIKKRSARSDTLYPVFSENHYGWTEKAMHAIYSKAWGYYRPLPADTIYPERMKIFWKVDHVSEIVRTRSSGRLWLAGLTWKSRDDYNAFYNQFNTTGSSPFAGFRVVLIRPNDSGYKNPFW